MSSILEVLRIDAHDIFLATQAAFGFRRSFGLIQLALEISDRRLLLDPRYAHSRYLLLYIESGQKFKSALEMRGLQHYFAAL